MFLPSRRGPGTPRHRGRGWETAHVYVISDPFKFPHATETQVDIIQLIFLNLLIFRVIFGGVTIEMVSCFWAATALAHVNHFHSNINAAHCRLQQQNHGISACHISSRLGMHTASSTHHVRRKVSNTFAIYQMRSLADHHGCLFPGPTRGHEPRA